MRKPFIAGNWKMHKNNAEAKAYVEAFKQLVNDSDVEVGLCVPYTQLETVKEAVLGTRIKVCSQNIHFEENGAYTGEISPGMLAEIGVDYTVIGHSERREYYNETDETVNKKIITAFAHKILPILCVGETLEQNESGKTKEVVKAQIEKALKDVSAENTRKIVVAYEPIWAIGTGLTATPEQANDTIAYIREEIKNLYNDEVSEAVRIQYGGSVKPNNASDIMNQEDIDGALVGGASLKPEDFIEIVNF